MFYAIFTAAGRGIVRGRAGLLALAIAGTAAIPVPAHAQAPPSEAVYRLTLWSPLPVKAYEISQLFEHPDGGPGATDTCEIAPITEGTTYDMFRDIVVCRVPTGEGGTEIAAEDWTVELVSATGLLGGEIAGAKLCPTCFDADGGCEIPYLCGDVNGDGEIRAADALRTLISAVSCSESTPAKCCDPVYCDVDPARGDTTDALEILRAAIGIAQPLMCPPPC
jgi:hypothetical protein